MTLSGQTLADWYALANHLAQTAYIEEGATYHPTIVVNGGMQGLGNVDYQSDNLSMDWVDMWGQNTYFGWDAHCFDYYDRLSAKPLIFTEYGIDAWDNRAGTEYQAVQAAWDVHQYRQIRAACVGATVMAYSDEWWKAGDPNSHDFGGYGTGYHPDGYSNEEWWGMVSVQDNGNAPDSVQPHRCTMPWRKSTRIRRGITTPTGTSTCSMSRACKRAAARQRTGPAAVHSISRWTT